MVEKQLRTKEVDNLLHVLSALKDEDVIFALLQDMFTVREIRESSQRLEVAQMLDAGKSYAAIESATGASATTIARVSKCLGYGAGGYAAALQVLAAASGEEPEGLDAAAPAAAPAASADDAANQAAN